MKINRSEPLIISSAVREKSEKDGFARFSKNHQDKESQHDQNQETLEATEEQVRDAIESFHAGEKPLGLDVSLEGMGPGLKVILKDGSGAVVRQMTGDEFVKLKQVAEDSRRGRLLDKKC